MNKVFVTGIGLVTPLGIGTAETWNGLIQGRCALGPISSINPSSLRTHTAGEVSDFAPQKYVTNRRALRLMTRGDQFAFAAVKLALQDAFLEPRILDSDRTGIFIGGSKEISDPQIFMEPVLSARNDDGTFNLDRFAKVALSDLYPLFFVEGLPASSLFFLSEAYGIKGPNAYFAGTADASAVAVGRAYRAIRRGEVDIAIAGGFDASLVWLNLIKLEALEVTSDRNDLGASAYRPYDKSRSGSILGEGAAFLILEEEQRAMQRDARIYAEVAGFGSGYDAYKLIHPHPEGRGLAYAMEAALREADVSPADVGYIASHGSGTRLGDVSETAAIRAVFHDDPDKLAASSVKPSTGHLVAAAGSLNVAVSALALHHHILPPTLHLQDMDPACNLDWIPLQAREAQIEASLALARGLEGQNVALALRKY